MDQMLVVGVRSCFRMAIGGYQYPTYRMLADADWLITDLSIDTGKARVAFRDACTQTYELASWKAELERLLERRIQTAALAPLESFFDLVVIPIVSSDQYELIAMFELWGNGPCQSRSNHRFSISLSRDEITTIIEQLGAILEAYPVRDVERFNRILELRTKRRPDKRNA